MEGDPIRVTTQLLASTDKKVHYFHRMYHATAGYLAATNELLSLQVDVERRRAAPFAPSIRERLREVARAQGELPWPPQAGRVIGVDARPPPGQ
jgi:acyl-CoA thioester hydrolase